MRINTAGLESKKATPFWSQQPIVCPNCQCEFELDEDDGVLVVVGADFSRTNCPHCQETLILNQGSVDTLHNVLEKERASHRETAALYNDALVRISELQGKIHELSANNRESGVSG